MYLMITTPSVPHRPRWRSLALLVLCLAPLLWPLKHLAELVKTASDAGKSSFQLFNFLVLAAVIYLLIAVASNSVLHRLERRFAVGFERGAR